MTTPSALEGIVVIDMAAVIAGPGIARHLGDFGADVIKVEPPTGDVTRRMGWRHGDADAFFWKLLGRNKRCVVADLHTDEGIERLWSLIARADVIIENMRPGKLEKLGLTIDEMHRRRPSLVIVRVTGFGQTGPYADRAGFGTIIEAMTGLSSLLGEVDGPPLLPPIALIDEVTAIAGAFATLTALRHAERTGEGQVVDLSLLETMIQLLGPLVSAHLELGYQPPRLGSGIAYSVPRGTYRCEDESWVALSVSTDATAHRLMSLLGVADDPRFDSFAHRVENRVELERRTSEWFAARSSERAVAACAAADIPITPVMSIADLLADAHVRAREVVQSVDGVAMQGVIAWLSKTPGVLRNAGRALGADQHAVFGPRS